ncbi:MAG TPA: CDP-alcohol phosphatidyltransferase family protein [Desulfovibrio sp.]|jgi:cardiolipin synthase|nr:CDP-alcohol phosphatidyltransferase family protein [Desulfovibrio aminophilus]MDY0305477.1 CDP-alcohol phosphatidyltransferase family protein [Desulfovibrionaceae bacterium]HMM40150.1 CDP-alcohol phosphatidyltransferase family protein [Desulfovibrio sp.]
MPLREDNWTIPNLLTISRILLTPAFAAAFTSHRFDLAWGLFALAGLTDALDGLLARLLHQRTRLGGMLDPLADKVLLVTSFICLSLAGFLPAWLAALVVSRDAIIVGGLVMLNFWGVEVRNKIRPSLWGKLTTAAQISLVFMVMLQESLGCSWPLLQDGLILLAAALTAVSGLHYVLRGFALFPVPDDDERFRR